MHIVYELLFTKRMEEAMYPYRYIGSKSNCTIVNNQIHDSRNRLYFGSSRYDGYSDIVMENLSHIEITLLFQCDTYAECLQRENQIHIERGVVDSLEYFNIREALNNCFHSPDTVSMKNVISGQIRRIPKNHPNILNGDWVGTTSGMHWYNNGTINKVMAPEDAATNGWIRGRLWGKVAHNKGKSQTYEEIQKRVITRHANGNYGAWNKNTKGMYIHTEETKKKMSMNRKGRIGTTTGKLWITDGTKNRLINNDIAIPCGWHRGQTKKKR